MKKTTLLFLTLFCVFHAMASESIEIGTSHSIHSEVLNEDRPYMVYLPPSYESNENTFPVIYLLDGDVHRFKGFVGVLEALSTETLGQQIQQAIVVAIPNTNRSRDLTPSVLKTWTFKEQVLDTFEETGMAQKFSNFLQQELIPKIESSYTTSKQRILVGESFGGLFAANTLLHSPSLFSDYLIIDPTALWDNDYLNRTYESRFKETQIDSNVFFAFANNSHLGEIGLTNYKWGSTFAGIIVNKAQTKASQQYFEKESHGTVAFLAWYHGLKALLPK